jgi:hypothetical protein
MAAAAPEDGEPEPFSPSMFLDLPPTPSDDGDDDPPLPDDLVLPYISHMLMEEDMDDRFFYQYPDHPVLLQAQLPFADILLSDAATEFSSSSLDAATTASGSGTTFFTHSPSSSSSCVDVVPASASATWPYDPLELTQRLMAGAASSASSLPRIEQAGSQFHVSTDKGSQQSHVQNRVSMDMINQAFLKGMEEANKFLPGTTTISSSSRGRRKNRGHDD